MKRTAIFFLAAALLNGCGTYKRYSRPEMELNAGDSYRHTTTPADTATLASKPWRELFTDPRLQTLIATGLDRNTDLAVARLQTEQAQATLKNARQAYLPSLGLTAQAGVSHYDNASKRTYDAGLTAAWEADIFGRKANAQRGAAAVLEQDRAYEQAVQTGLVATIAESYYTLLMLDEQTDIARQTLENWNETVATLEALAAAGRANEVAVRQARASRAALEASVLTLQKSVSETENSLCALLKEPAHAVVRGTLGGQRLPDSISAGVPLQLLSNRPDIRRAEAALAEAFYAVGAARSAFYPSLTLSGTIGWTNSGGGAILNPGKWFSSAIAQLTAPLLDRGTNTANLKVARARQQQAALRFEQSLLDAASEVNDALAAWQTACGRIALARQQTDDLGVAVEKTRLLVRHSPANYLEVLTAQQALLEARLTLARDRTDALQSVVSLYHALGGGKD